MKNYEHIDDKIKIDDADSLNSVINPLQNEIMVNEGVEAENKGVDSEYEGGGVPEKLP